MPFSRRAFLATSAAMLPVLRAADRPPIKIVSLSPTAFDAAERKKIEKAASGVKVEFIVPQNRDEARKLLADAEVIYGEPRGPELDSAPKLKWVQAGGAGMEWMDKAAKESPAVFTNMARIFAPGISETAMGLLLSLTHRIGTDYIPQFAKRQWKPLGDVRSADHVELAGKTMGIVGMGGIGSEIARRAHMGFDMRVVGTDARPMAKPFYVEELHDPSWFMTMVPQVDVLVSAAPHTPQTERMFNEQVFRSMKKTAYFIAMSRGKLFDDMALVKALKEGWIAGAGLDVFPIEPVPSTHPIFDCPNVVMTPHTSGWGPDRQTRLLDLFTDNIRRYAAGMPLRNVVDKAAGY